MSKLTGINKCIERDSKKLEEVEKDATYSDEQRQLHKDRLDDLNTEKQARLEILSQNRKDLQTQVARVKQILEKISDKNIYLPGKICILICEQITVIISTLSALSAGIATIVLSIMGDLRGGGGTGGSPPKDKGTLKKWSDMLADTLKRLAGKAAKALPAITGSVVSAVSNLLGKAVGFVAEHTFALIVFAAKVIDLWLMQKVKKN